MGSTEILVSGGVAAILAAAVGGGMKAFGTELPLMATLKRQAFAFLVGVGLVMAGLANDGRLSWPGGTAEADASEANRMVSNSVEPAAPPRANPPARGGPGPAPAASAARGPGATADGEALLVAATNDDLDGVRRNLTRQTFGARAADGMNALMIAADKCRMGIARYMLDSGVLTRADIDARNAHGDTALAIAGGTDSELRAQNVTRQRCPALIPLLQAYSG